MSRKFVTKDIYDKEGRFLLAAGNELTDDTLLRLEKMGIEVQDYLSKDDVDEAVDDPTRENAIKHSEYIKNSADRLKATLRMPNDLFNSSSDIVIDIIFNSKDKPWGLHLNTLSNYIDWVYTHSINVAIISVVIAQALSIKTKLKDIALGAILHDIGKLLIPKSILLKNGTLTENELNIVHRHSDLGTSMLTGCNLKQISLDIIQQHHERMDGGGYPFGLKEGQIAIYSKIVIVADVLDAITSPRPYRPARSLQSAIDELKKDTSRYPQDVIDIFQSLVLRN